MVRKIWLDTEFAWPQLLSVGAIREDGSTFYAEVHGAPTRYANPFVQEQVLPKLHGLPRGGQGNLVCPQLTEEHVCPLLSPSELASAFTEFCGPTPEFWADYGAYDYVALSELLGGMDHWPEGWPQFFHDIQMWTAQLQHPPLPELVSNQHNALADAMQCRVRWEHLLNTQNEMARQVLRPTLAQQIARPSGLVVPEGRA